MNARSLLAGLFRRRRPDLQGRAWPGGGYGGGDGWDEDDTSWLSAPAGEPARQPWDTAEQPALTGAGTLGSYWAAEDLRAQRIQQRAAEFAYAARAGWGAAPVIPEGLVRPWSPGPVSAPATRPEPVMVYPPLSFRADFRDLPVFRAAARKAGTAPAGLVRDGAAFPSLAGYFPPGWMNAALDALPDEVAA